VRSRGLGIAVKVADGSRRALLPTVVAVLDRLGLLDDGRRARLQSLAEPTLRNYRRTAVGQVRAVVVLRPGGAT
jgi:L-asparaginase II